MSACMSEFKKMFKFATNLNHKVVSSSTMDIYVCNRKTIKLNRREYRVVNWYLSYRERLVTQMLIDTVACKV